MYFLKCLQKVIYFPSATCHGFCPRKEFCVIQFAKANSVTSCNVRFVDDAEAPQQRVSQFAPGVRSLKAECDV